MARKKNATFDELRNLQAEIEKQMVELERAQQRLLQLKAKERAVAKSTKKKDDMWTRVLAPVNHRVKPRTEPKPKPLPKNQGPPIRKPTKTRSVAQALRPRVTPPGPTMPKRPTPVPQRPAVWRGLNRLFDEPEPLPSIYPTHYAEPNPLLRRAAPKVRKIYIPKEYFHIFREKESAPPIPQIEQLPHRVVLQGSFAASIPLLPNQLRCAAHFYEPIESAPLSSNALGRAMSCVVA